MKALARMAAMAVIVFSLASCGAGEEGEDQARVVVPVPEAAADAGSLAAAPPVSEPSPPPCPAPLPGSEIVTVREGERVEVFDAPRGEPIGTAFDETDLGVQTTFAVAERDGCWLGVNTELAGNQRLGWVRFDVDRLALSFTRYSLRVDLSERRLLLVRGDRELEEIVVTVGAPATPTPTGRFGITGVFTGGLNPVYGCCALALSAVQTKLPLDGPIGNTIAIHGWIGSVGDASSHGCLRATDPDLRTLMKHLPLGAPVAIQA